MNIEKIVSLTYLLLLVFGCNNVSGSEKKNGSYIENINDKELTFQPLEVGTPADVKFIEQEINYYAPLSGSVYLVWKIKNYSLEKSVFWNEHTKLTDGLLYTPMAAHGDTFSIRLKMPVGSSFNYYFWISKNKQGHYQDFWDLQSSGKKKVTDTLPISEKAIYSKIEKKNGPQIISKGWLIFLFLIGIFVMLQWVQKKWFSKIEAPTQIEKVLFLGFSLIIFQALARAEIIAVNPMNIIYDSRDIVKIVRGSLSDFIFAAGIVIIFTLALLWIKNIKIRKLVYGIFLSLILFSTIVAYTNITTVIFLGKPFTFQWLYYSDFLGSNEAKTALQENLSISIVFNLIALCLSMLILSSILCSAYRLIASQKYLKYITFSLLGLGLMVLIVRASMAKETWTKGQSENAITSMIYSILAVNSNSLFFSAEIPDDMEPFIPGQSTKLETPLGSLKEHKVKNVLFIILESAGACYFDAYGGTYQLSANLNKYVSHSLIFDQMYAYAPATNRTLISILGSMYPYLSYKSITQEAPEIDHPTLSSVLKNQGYRTSFFTSANLNFQNSKQFLEHRQFDCLEDFSTIKCSEEFIIDNDNYMEGNGIDDMCLSDRLASWIDEDTTRNFFSMIWTVQGHYPYFFANEEEDFRVSDYNFNRYLNCLKHNDELIGEVMQTLNERGLATTTLVVVTGDHGEAFGQHQQYGHGSAIYEENLRVPLYFINPILFHGERKRDIAGMKDLATTTLSIINVDIPKKWQGRDLLSTNSNEAFFFAPWSDYLFGYRKDSLKFIFNESRNTVEVYNLNTDPGEKINLVQSGMNEEVTDARNRVAAWVQFQDKFVNQILRENN